MKPIGIFLLLLAYICSLMIISLALIYTGHWVVGLMVALLLVLGVKVKA